MPSKCQSNYQARFKGRLYDVDPHLANGVWIKPHQSLAMLADDSSWVVEAYLRESEVARVSPGASVRVKVREQNPYFLDGVVESIDASPVSNLPHSMLDFAAGGPFTTTPHGASSLEPMDVLFRLRIRLLEQPRSIRLGLADVTVQGEARAWLPERLKRALPY